MSPEDWRQNQAQVAKQLKRNKALESAKINGLIFLSIDANEHFASFSRTCPRCASVRSRGSTPKARRSK